MSSESGTSGSAVEFSAILEQAAIKQATGIVIPPDVLQELNAGKKPAALVAPNGYEYRTTVGVMSGNSMIPVSAAVRKESGVAAGDLVEVRLTVDASPRSVDIPADFATAMAAAPVAAAFFQTLSNSLQRYHVDNVNGAKTADTRQRRIDKAVGLFLDGKPR